MASSRNLIPVLFLLASPAFAGWSMTQVITNSGGRGEAGNTTQRVWMEGSSAKIEFLETDNPMMERGSYLLIQDGGKKTFLVNPTRKTYSRFDVTAITSGMDAMAGSGMEMKVENPKMEKLLEEPGEDHLGYPTTHYRFHTTYTMVVSMPMGMNTSTATDTVEDLWTTPAIEAGGAGEAMAGLSGSGGMMKELAKLAEKQKSTIKGLPLKQVTVTQSKSTSKGIMGRMMGGGGGDGTTTITMEVKDLDETALPAATFQIPAGYSETEILQRGPAMPDLDEEKN